MPVVSPCGTRHNHHIVQFDRLLSDHRPTILVDLASGPILLGERCRRQKLSILRIKHVKEAVFRRLHDHSAARAIFSKRKICKHHLLRGRKVPLITGCCLVMPPISPSVRVEREYGGQEQVVIRTTKITLRVAYGRIPGRAISNAHEHLVIHCVVDNRVPGSATAAVGCPSASVTPAVIRQLSKNRIRRSAIRLFIWVGDRIKTPLEVTALDVVGSDVTSHTQLRARVSNDHLVLENSRRARNGVRL